MTEKHNWGVLIGRFEPFHNGHLKLVQFALERVNSLIIVLGSCNAARSIKNPWTGPERQGMITACLSGIDKFRVHFVHASDYLYNDNRWLTSIQSQVEDITDGDDDVVLFGEEKDRSSFYLKMFPQWKHISSGGPIVKDLDATKIRELYFTQRFSELESRVPVDVYERLVRDTSGYEKPYYDLCQEFRFVQDYKSKWAEAPYPPTFVTVDTVVIRSGHVLLVRRKGYPGKGLMALPGGFLNQHERIRAAAIRELREETSIAFSKEDLDSCIVDEHVFDHPDRSTRGRTVTHAFCLNLGAGKLPRVKGDDDAEKAFWLSFTDIAKHQDQFYEDHAHIISHFVNKF